MKQETARLAWSVVHVVAVSLEFCARITGLTYNEINIVVYYLIAPFIFAAIADSGFRRHWLKLGVALVWVSIFLIIPDFNVFSNWLFEWSVGFLKFFAAVGLNYIEASVLICVILPLAALIFLVVWKRRRVLHATTAESAQGGKTLRAEGMPP